MIREYILRIDDTLNGALDDIDELERKWGAEELPKGHGDLIDRDSLFNSFNLFAPEYYNRLINDLIIKEAVIIEADKEEE